MRYPYQQFRHVLCALRLLAPVLAAVTAILSAGCTTDRKDYWVPVAVDHVDGPYQLDSCVYRYYVTVTPHSQNDYSYYWVGLIEANDTTFRLVSTGNGQYAYGGLDYNLELYVDLASSDHVDHRYSLYAYAFCTSSSQNQGNIEIGECVRWSDPVTYPGFPSECYPFTIALSVDGQDISQGECVYIDQEAQMPYMVARIANGSIQDQARWKLTIKYDRTGTVYGDSVSDWLYGNSYWYINDDLGSRVAGGKAALTCKSALDTGYTAELDFFIRAYNPDEEDAVGYINSRPNAKWYCPLVAKQEGGNQIGRWYIQFNEIPENENCGHVSDIRHTPNWDGVIDPPGFGMFQLTYFTINGTTRGANTQELWSWKQNVQTGVSLLAQHQAGAFAYMADERAKTSMWVPEIYVGDDSILLSDFTNKWVDDAVALKRYNGLGIEPHYEFCRFDMNSYSWQISRYSVIQVNNTLVSQYYVDQVCSRLVD